MRILNEINKNTNLDVSQKKKNTRTTFSFSVFHPFLFIKTHTIPSSVSFFYFLPCPFKPTPRANTRKKKAAAAKRGGGFIVRFEVDSVWV